MANERRYGVQRNCLTPDTILKEKYRMGVLLGSGNFGMTYMAYDTVLQQMVAIKEYFPNGLVVRGENGMDVDVIPGEAEKFEKGKQSFKDEASRIFGMFDLPGICAVRDYFEANGTAYIVEEYLSGGTLKEYLKQKNEHRISWEECREIFTPVLHGLNQLHAIGIIHRDISPDNLMFSSLGELKLIDFGAAKQCAGEDLTLVVKEYYAAPEQYKDNQMVGPWSDLFALCSVMYEALSGRRPVPSLERMKKDSMPKISSTVVIPENIEHALFQGMSLDIQKRYFFAGNLMEKLGMDSTDSKILLGKIRGLWGEAWLLSITEKSMDIQEKKHKGFNISQIRWILAAITASAIGCLCIFSYFKANPEVVFDYKLNQAQKQVKSIGEGADLITENDPEFEKIVEVIAPYEIEHTWSSSAVSAYEVPEDILIDLNLYGRGHFDQGKFYLKQDTVFDIFEYYLDQELKWTGTTYDGSVTIDEKDAIRYLDVYALTRDKYQYISSDGQKNSIEVAYDPVDERVQEVTFVGAIKDVTLFLKDIFPYIVPETYLTDHEIETFLKSSKELFERTDTENQTDSEETKENYVSGFIYNHAKFELYVYSSLTTSKGYEYVSVKLSTASDRSSW